MFKNLRKLLKYEEVAEDVNEAVEKTAKVYKENKEMLKIAVGSIVIFYAGYKIGRSSVLNELIIRTF